MIFKQKLKLLILLLIGIYLPSTFSLNENNKGSKKTITITTLKRKDNLNKRNDDTTSTETEILDCNSEVETETLDYETWDYTTLDYEEETETINYEDETVTTNYEEETETPGVSGIQRKICEDLNETYVDSEMKIYKSQLQNIEDNYYYYYILIKTSEKVIIDKYNKIIIEIQYMDIKCTKDMIEIYNKIILQDIKEVINNIVDIKKKLEELIRDYNNNEIINNKYLNFLNDLLMNWDNNKCNMYYPSSTKIIKKEIAKCENRKYNNEKIVQLHKRIEEMELNLKKILEYILRIKDKCDKILKCQLVSTTLTETTSTTTSTSEVSETTSTTTSTSEVSETTTTTTSTSEVSETATTMTSTSEVSETATTMTSTSEVSETTSTTTSTSEDWETTTSEDWETTTTIPTTSDYETTIETYCEIETEMTIDFDIEIDTTFYELSLDIETEISTDYETEIETEIETESETEIEEYTITGDETVSFIPNDPMEICKELKFFEYDLNFDFSIITPDFFMYKFSKYNSIINLVPKLNKDFRNVTNAYWNIRKKCKSGMTNESLHKDIDNLKILSGSVNEVSVLPVISNSIDFIENNKELTSTTLHNLTGLLNSLNWNNCKKYIPSFVEKIENSINSVNDIKKRLLPEIEKILERANKMEKACLMIEERCKNNTICKNVKKCSVKENSKP